MATSRNDPIESAPPGRCRVVVLAWAGLVLAIGLLVYFAPFRGKPVAKQSESARDPRLEYSGPFRSVDPAVRFVPEDQCASCHADHAGNFAKHPMGRSLFLVSEAPSPPTDEKRHNPFEALESQFLVALDGKRVFHKRSRLDANGRSVAQQQWDVHYVLGSGTRGHSYLTDRDGYVYQTPVSWFSQKDMWSLSPGFDRAVSTGRAVLPACLYCHSNRAHHIEDTMNRYTQPVFTGHSIGCQRCHGPGELHVKLREMREPAAPGPDYTIVNPRHLDRPLREAVCEQCHLQGESRVLGRGRGIYDYRPGMPLELFWSAFNRPAETASGQKAVGHVEQMYQSKCFQGQAGANRLGCVSCHDPHVQVLPAERVAHYRNRCLQCHEQQGCKLPPAERLRRSAQDSCIDCHMPRYGPSDIPHTAATDHRILRDDKSAPLKEKRPAGASFPITSFYRGRPTVDAAEDDRNLAVAVSNLALAGNAAASSALRFTLPGFEDALKRDPNDGAAGEAYGHALGLLGRRADALAAFEAVLARTPERELSLVGAAAMSEALGQAETARRYWRQAIAVNPWPPAYRRSLTMLLIKQEAWSEAEPESDAWIRVDPLSAEARTARLQCLLAVGNKDEARAEFTRIEALAPANLRELQIRYGKRVK